MALTDEATARHALQACAAGRHFLTVVDGKVKDAKLAIELLSAGAALASSGREGATGKENAAPAAAFDPSSALVTLKAMSCINPRAKYDIAFSRDALHLSNPKGALLVPSHLVTHVAILDQIPKDTKKRCLIFIVLDRQGEAVMNGKQRLDAIIVQTLESESLCVSASDGEVMEGPAAAVLCQALGLSGVTAFIAPDEGVYKSTKGHLAVGAVVKVSSGHLFPLPGALLFVEKPALFVPHGRLLAVEYRRAQSATFDLVLHVREGSSVQQLEFSQVDRAELGRLQSYFAAARIKLYDPAAPPRVEAPGAGGSGAGGAGAGAADVIDMAGDDEEDEDEDEDDDDFDPVEYAELERGRPSKRARSGCDGAGPSGSGAGGSAAGPSSALGRGQELGGAEAEEEEEDEDEAGSSDEEDEDEDDGMDDLTDEEDLAADAVRGRLAREEEEEEDDEEDDVDDEDD